MSVELPTPRAWLDEQLKRLQISQNELARRAGLAQSQVHSFAKGTCGTEAAVKIANALNVPATITLALIGKVPPPAKWSDVDADSIAHVYRQLDDEDRQAVMALAQFLRQRQLNRVRNR